MIRIGGECAASAVSREAAVAILKIYLFSQLGAASVGLGERWRSTPDFVLYFLEHKIWFVTVIFLIFVKRPNTDLSWLVILVLGP